MTQKPALEDHVAYTQLTAEKMSPVTWSHVIQTFLVMLVGLVIVNFLAYWYLLTYPTNRGYWLVHQKWELLDALEQPVDWVILGDSSCNQGIVPEFFVESGETAVNLCTVASMTAIDDAWLLQAYIDKFGPPESVLVIHTHDAWQRNLVNIFLAKTPIPFGEWRSYKPAVTPTLSQSWQIWQARYTPILTDNTSLSRSIKNAILLGKPFFQKRYQRQESGYMSLLQADVNRLERDLRNQTTAVANTPFRISAQNLAALQQLDKLATNHSINLYLANNPLFIELYQTPQFQTYYEEMQSQLTAVTAEANTLTYIPTYITFPAEVMELTDHTLNEGAISYSSQLRQLINEQQP